MNLLCKAFIAILDILLLDFYLKNIYPDIYKNKLKTTKYIIYLSTFIGLSFINSIVTYTYTYIGISLLLLFIYSFYHINKLDFTRKIFIFYFIKILILIFIVLSLTWIFNTRYYTFYTPNIFNYTILSYIISDYILFTLLLIKYKNKIHFNLQYFKLLTILILIYFAFIFIFNNPILFLTPSIARTYIFTVIISIVALICFDRMQTKYETDKHAKEAMIQNMTKEEEFIKQLQNQQLEIRKINHNLNNILIILQAHLKNGEYDEAIEYIEQNLKIHVKAYQDLTHTGIPTLDSILNNQIYLMKEKNIEYHEDITKILHLGNVKADDLSLAISLALDNAREACEKVDAQRQISLSLQSKQTHVVLYIANSIPQGSHPHFHKTTKADKIAHGHGVKSIKEIARKYHGDVKYDIKDNQVILRIMLQK